MCWQELKMDYYYTTAPPKSGVKDCGREILSLGKAVSSDLVCSFCMEGEVA